VLGLLNDIRGAWIAIGPEIRKAGQSQPMSAAAAG
jgi:hypothetical protein